MDRLRSLIKQIIYESLQPKIIEECINVSEGDQAGKWVLSMGQIPDGGNTTNGFGFQVGKTPYLVSPGNGSKVKAVAMAFKSWMSSWESDREPPFRPADALMALKHNGLTLDNASVVVEPHLQMHVADVLSFRATSYVTGKKIDIVTTPESSSQLANEFGRQLARRIGAKFVPSGMLKDAKNAEAVDPLPEKLKADIKALKSFLGALKRMKASNNPSIKSLFHASQRDLVTKWLRPSNDFIDTTKGIENERNGDQKTTVLLVDDVVTTGSSFAEMNRVLGRLGGYKVVDNIAMFKMQDSIRGAKKKTVSRVKKKGV